VIDLTKVPPFADAAWVNEPNAPCLWCAGTGHVNGDYVGGEICKCPDQPYHPAALCECGDAECLGSVEVAGVIAASIAEALPQLQSPMLRLIQERNEARELVKRVLMATDGVTDSEEYYAAMLAAHRAVITWKGGAK
jgi:hypothetical protein